MVAIWRKECSRKLTAMTSGEVAGRGAIAATRNGDVIGGWRLTIGREGTKLPPSTKPKAEDGIERGVVPVCPILLPGGKKKKKTNPSICQ
jgi:hypothetical protein